MKRFGACQVPLCNFCHEYGKHYVDESTWKCKAVQRGQIQPQRNVKYKSV